eukprot:TRINITY_DN2468_c0_g1_i2.p1 TRINITY_DN2468_c0_g1~~TRINITY_DN2468_c0_g1_i2.p1  ORF type:complete len:306 (+),score=125.83 TRINITY_DN2468_c0_g1_i2:89-919(+)
MQQQRALQQQQQLLQMQQFQHYQAMREAAAVAAAPSPQWERPLAAADRWSAALPRDTPNSTPSRATPAAGSTLLNRSGMTPTAAPADAADDELDTAFDAIFEPARAYLDRLEEEEAEEKEQTASKQADVERSIVFDFGQDREIGGGGGALDFSGATDDDADADFLVTDENFAFLFEADAKGAAARAPAATPANTPMVARAPAGGTRVGLPSRPEGPDAPASSPAVAGGCRWGDLSVAAPAPASPLCERRGLMGALNRDAGIPKCLDPRLLECAVLP